MTNKKTTRRALTLSVLSLLLCVSMLVGTTFAWFTDSVTSGRNQIIAGNLDVTLDYYDAAAKAFKPVDGNTKIFDDNALWEPGHTEIAYLKVANAGTLALKYQLLVNVYSEQGGTNVAGDPFKLSEHLVFKVIEIEENQVGTFTRDDARKAAGTEMGLKAFEGEVKALEKTGDADYVMLVIYMPEEVGNEANYKTNTAAPKIEMGVVLNATQYTYEYDSFGKDYDKNADVTVTYVSTLADLQDAVNKGGLIELTGDILIPADAPLNTTAGALPSAIAINSGKPVDLNLKGYNIIMEPRGTTDAPIQTALLYIHDTDVTISGDGKLEQKGLDNSYTVWAKGKSTVSIESGNFVSNTPDKKGIMLYASGNTAWDATDDFATINVYGGNFTSTSQGMTDYYANVMNHGVGKINYYGGTFNWNPAVDVPYDDRAHIKVAEGYVANDNGDGTWTVGVENMQNLIDGAQNGDTVTLPAGSYTLPTMSAKEGITIQGVEGTVIGGENATTGFASNFGKSNTYKNLDFEGSSNGVRWSYANGGTTTFEDCTFAGDSTYGFHIDQSNGATFIFNNCTFSGFNAFAGDLVKIQFNNCTFLHNGSYGHTNIWSVAEFNNCTFGDKTSVSPAGSGKLFFDGVEESYHHEFIGSAESLVAFKETVAGGDTWKGQKVVLVDDINLAGIQWDPTGNFAGTFDGNGHTISNLTVTGTTSVGFFKNLYTTAVVEDVIFSNANVSGEHYVGVVVGWEGNETANAQIRNVTVEDSTITCNTDASNDNGDKAGAICGYAVTLTIENCTVKNTTVKAYRDFGGILGYANGAKVHVKNNTVENVTLVIDNEVNYKNYTTDAEHDANPVVGEIAGGAVVQSNTVK